VSIYNTAMMGAAFSMELYNTGAVRSHRLFENTRTTLVQGALGGPSTGAASGLSVYAGSDLFFVNIGLSGPLNATDLQSPDVGFNFSNYYRLAITPKIAEGMELMIGIQGILGSTKGSGGVDSTGKGVVTQSASSPIAEFKTDVMTIDAQLSGEAGGMDYMVVLAYQTNGKDNGIYNLDSGAYLGSYGYAADATGLSINAILGITPMAGAKIAYLSVDQKAANSDYSYITLGGYYNFAQNILLDLEYSAGSGEGRISDSELLLMLEVGI